MAHGDSVTVRDLRSLDWPRVKGLKAVVPGHVVYKSLASETVLLNIETGAYHGMDEVGSRRFEALRNCADLESACDLLVRENGAPEERIRRDLIAHCSELVSSGFLELRESRR